MTAQSIKVALFLMALVFLLVAFATSISALNHHLVDFDGAPRSAFRRLIGGARGGCL